LRPVIARHVAAHLERGTASASFRVAYRHDGEPMLRIDGSARMDDLRVG
jgi:hypothetical protein